MGDTPELTRHSSNTMNPKVTVTTHPLARHLVTNLRDARTLPAQFRNYSDLLTVILALEATHDLAVATVPVETPLETMDGIYLAT